VNKDRSKTLSKNFFLISFLPAIAYWYLEANYPIRIAIAGGLILAILEITFEWFYTKHVHTLSKFNFFLILFLGGISLIGDEGIWFKLQPAFTGVGIGAFLGYRLFKGKGMMLEMMESMNKEPPPEFVIKTLESHMAILFGLYGIFMAFVALKLNTDQWLFFKTIGFYIIFGVFFLFEMVYMRFQMKKFIKRKQHWDNL
jgi:intracellular septation protein